ncbi:hypothetical protein CUMW_007160 [Citrus unshiu]|nr:hypothetical protein CUMW_007160 [Citrus unshiu]
MEGGSPDQESVGSGTRRSSVSSGGRSRNRKDFLYRFVDCGILTAKLEDWFISISEKSALKKPALDVPFELIELQKFDYALEGVSFQQLIRMPNAVYASTSDAVEATAYLAVEDFLHASVKGLWEAFWSHDEPMPFSVSCLYNANLKFYQAEKAIANGKLEGLCGTGLPKHSIEDLAADHSSRLQTRRVERQLGDTGVNGNGVFRFQRHGVSTEIVEVQDESINIESEELMKLEIGSVLWLEDSNFQKGYQINEVLRNGDLTYYVASPVEDPGKSLFLYVGSHPSQLEPAWQDMNLWYQVQRQTKVLTIMKQKGFSSKYLPQLSASGRIIHPGQCRRPSSGGNCDHPLCGTPILVTSPVGETVANMVSEGRFGLDEAIRCCHDCLSALSTVSSAGIRHGDIRPENVICVRSGVRHPYFVLIGWGHAILEDRDRPAMNLHFSSTYALQEGKLCSASDAESLVYMLYFSCGGALPELDSVEGALQWRETSWSRRIIQQKLGDVSTVLKAFADYVDSLCGTPYPIDYDIWLRRLRKNIHEEDHGKEIDTSG